MALLDFFSQTDSAEIKQLLRTAGELASKVTLDAASEECEFKREHFNLFGKAGLTQLGSVENDLLFGSYATAGVIKSLAECQLGPAIYLSVHLMVSKLLAKNISSDFIATESQKLISGEKLAAFCLTEPGAGSDAAALSCSAVRTDKGYLLQGEKIYITSGPVADTFLVFAKTGESKGKPQISSFMVPAETPGLVRGKSEKKMGCEGAPICSIGFEDCEISEDNRVGAEGDGYKIALSGLAGGRVNIAAAACGLAAHGIQLASNHMKTRKQFGQYISEFQGLQFMLADMISRTNASILLTREAAKCLDRGERATSEAAVAKCFATDSAMQTTLDSAQLMGGSGYLREFGAEKLIRDAKMLQIVEGTNQIQKTIIASAALSD
jgi:alkylation response protein AidB-like acyl-CoA dehydrogenase